MLNTKFINKIYIKRFLLKLQFNLITFKNNNINEIWIYLFKYNSVLISIKLFISIYKTPLQIAIEKGNTDIVQLLIECDSINANLPVILNIMFYKIIFYYFNYILL